MTAKPILTGDLARIRLGDVIQLIELGRMSGELRFTRLREPNSGHILFAQGEPIQACCGSLTANEGFYSFFAWMDGEFQFFPRDVEHEERRIARKGMTLTLDAHRLLDEGMIEPEYSATESQSCLANVKMSVKAVDALVQSMIMVISIDDEITKNEHIQLISSIERIWKEEYGKLADCLKAARQNLERFRILCIDWLQKAEENAATLATEFKGNEKKELLEIMTTLIKADGRIDGKERVMYQKFKEKLESG
jgi:uncharacterized tellurite resistance protein B-like protein